MNEEPLVEFQSFFFFPFEFENVKLCVLVGNESHGYQGEIQGDVDIDTDIGQ